MPLFAVKIPECGGKRLILQVQPDGIGPFGKGLMQPEIYTARLGQTGQVAFDVGQEHRDTGVRKPFGKDLQRDGLARAGRPRDQTVTVGVFQQKMLPFGIVSTTAANENPIAHVPIPVRYDANIQC